MVMEQLIWAIILSTFLYYLKEMGIYILVTAAIVLVAYGTLGLLIVKRKKKKWIRI